MCPAFKVQKSKKNIFIVSENRRNKPFKLFKSRKPLFCVKTGKQVKKFYRQKFRYFKTIGPQKINHTHHQMNQKPNIVHPQKSNCYLKVQKFHNKNKDVHMNFIQKNNTTTPPLKIKKRLSYRFMITKINPNTEKKIKKIKEQKAKISKKNLLNRELVNHNYEVGRWKMDEHKRFVEAIIKYGNDWKLVQKYVQTRSSTQARSHAQKFFIKIKKAKLLNFNLDLTKSSIQMLHNVLKSLNKEQFEKMIKDLNEVGFNRIDSNCLKRRKSNCKSSNNVSDTTLELDKNLSGIENINVINKDSINNNTNLANNDCKNDLGDDFDDGNIEILDNRNLYKINCNEKNRDDYFDFNDDLVFNNNNNYVRSRRNSMNINNTNSYNYLFEDFNLNKRKSTFNFPGNDNFVFGKNYFDQLNNDVNNNINSISNIYNNIYNNGILVNDKDLFNFNLSFNVKNIYDFDENKKPKSRKVSQDEEFLFNYMMH